MLERHLSSIVFSNEWGRQMRFITGPRQCGKTTLAKEKLRQEHSSQLYYLWDLRQVRERYKKNQLFFTEDQPPSQKKAWVCFDEIHKIPKWKNALKAIFDGSSDHYQFIITGSAKFDMFKKAGDSLSGRYFTFNLFPLSLSELRKPFRPSLIPAHAQEWIQEALNSKDSMEDALRQLLEYSGFPEPFLKASGKFFAKWARDYTDTVIKEDIAVFTRILEREHLYNLYHLLPEMAGSPLSESSLATHLELSNPTIKNYLKHLEDFYLLFRLRPYHKNIKRALIKAPKVYLYNWANIQDPAKRFENYVAVELFSRISLWKDDSEDLYRLFYIRNKQKEETDFLIVKNQAPWLLIEAKYSDRPLESHHYNHQQMLGNISLIQICRQEGVAAMEAKNVYRISASRFFAC